MEEPVHTIVTKSRMGLITVLVDGETYAITDIGMRMLKPHELLKASGFSKDYILTGTQEEQIARIGNAIPPPLARAVIAANAA
jgi:DNA (cytosine-5)-methyltransferase 1